MKRKILIYISIFVLLLLIVGFFTYKYMHEKYGDAWELFFVKEYKQPKIEKAYDVIVVGGEPEGVAAAVAAARNGMKTLLVEQRDGLGGLFTYGQLNFLDLSFDKDGQLANQGIFTEWHKLVGEGPGFDIERGKLALMKLVQDEDNLTLALETELQSVLKEANQIQGVVIKDFKGNIKEVSAKRFIDSTQDAELAVMADAPYFLGGGDIGLKDRKMAVTLMIHLEEVDWDKVRQAGKDGVFGGGTVNDSAAWGFGDLLREYEPHFENTRLRGLNILRVDNGDIYINALQIFGVDGLSEKEKADAIKIGKKETDYIVKFLNENFPGFEHAKVAGYPPELYVRETRHILAEYQLPMSDVWENKDHWDSIGLGSYPVDVQATDPRDYGYVLSRPIQYAIPFRSLVPLEVDGLLVASKASGYSSLAAGSARVVPVGMTTGQAAGVASAVSIKNDIGFRDLSQDDKLIKKLQETLKSQGARLYHFELEYSYQNEWFDPAIKYLLNYGLVIAGYENTLPVDKSISEQSFANLLSNGIIRMNPTDIYNRDDISYMRELVAKEKTDLTRNKAAALILRIYGIEMDGDAAWTKLKEMGITDEVINRTLSGDKVLLGSEGYYLAYLALMAIDEYYNPTFQ